MNYAEFTTRLFEQNQFAIKYDLEAMREAVALLGLPTLANTVVLIGGTNGKGSVACLLHAACLAAGLRTGLYTSPHLVDFRERVRVDGIPISEADCASLGGELFRRFSGRDSPVEGLRALSFFEITTLLAFTKFACSDLDVLILEVGMGGRLDATNVVEPDISVLTSVSLDHQQYLGDTVALIAREKAAIARNGKPCVLHRSSGGFEVLHAAIAEFDPQIQIVDGGDDAPGWNRALASRTFEMIATRHGIREEACASLLLSGFGRARWPARRHVTVNGGTTWFIDGAHNEASIADIAPWFRDVAGRVGRLPAVVGVSPGRDIGVVFRPLADCFAEVHVVPASAQRSVDPIDVVAGLEQAGWKGPFFCHSSASDAVRTLGVCANVACVGSLYLAGSVLQALGHTPESLSVYSHVE